MSYYIIDGIPVFLTWARYYKLRDEIITGFEIADDCFFGIYGRNSQQTSQLTSAINDLLARKKAGNEERFYMDWASFDIEGEEASDNVWELLCDYGVLTGNCAVRSIRDEQTFSPGQDAGTFGYSMGRLVAIDIWARRSLAARWIFGNKRLKTVMIDTHRVTRIKGTLDDFIVVYDDKEIRFSSFIELDESLDREAY